MILHIGDKYNKIVDVMNNCFGWNYKACMKGWYVLNTEKKTSAWFPKIANLNKGIPKPGDKWCGWCNTISSDNKYIYMNNFENPKLLDEIEEIHEEEPHITFVKFPREKHYTYVGVFVRVERDKNKGWIYKRISEDIDTSLYI